MLFVLKMKKTWLISLALTLSLTLWMTGCGVSSRTAAGVSQTPTVDKIQQRGTVLIGTTGDYRPLSSSIFANAPEKASTTSLVERSKTTLSVYLSSLMNQVASHLAAWKFLST